MSCRMLIAALAAAAAILPGHAGPGQAPAQSRPEPDLAAYDQGLAAAARSDLAASVRLPDGARQFGAVDVTPPATGARSGGEVHQRRGIFPAAGDDRNPLHAKLGQADHHRRCGAPGTDDDRAPGDLPQRADHAVDVGVVRPPTGR